MTAAVYFQQFRNSASIFLGQAREYVTEVGGAAYTKAREYITVKAPNANADYFEKADGTGAKIEDVAIKALAIQRETLVREKTRCKNVTNLTACGVGASPIIFGGWEQSLLVAVFVLPIFKGVEYIKQRIDRHYDARIDTLNEQISATIALQAPEQSVDDFSKKTE